MSNWIPITLANIYDAKVAALVDACDTAALGNGQANRSAGLIAGVVREIRDAVASCSLNRLDQNASAIPSGLKDLAVRRIIWALKGALELDVTDAEKIDFSADTTALKEIRDGTRKIEQPDNPLPSFTEVQVSYGVTAKAGKRKATHKKLEGLI
jgi:hypothetical protein